MQQHSSSHDVNNPERLVIYQATLEEFAFLKEQARNLERLRAQLLELLSQGAVVEDGLLGLEVQHISQKRLTWVKLTELLGEEAVNSLREIIPPTEITKLLLTEGKYRRLNNISPTQIQPTDGNQKFITGDYLEDSL